MLTVETRCPSDSLRFAAGCGPCEPRPQILELAYCDKITRSRHDPVSRAGARYDAVGEIGIDGKRLANAELLHDHKTQTVHEAVVLVLVLGEVRECI